MSVGPIRRFIVTWQRAEIVVATILLAIAPIPIGRRIVAWCDARIDALSTPSPSAG